VSVEQQIFANRVKAWGNQQSDLLFSIRNLGDICGELPEPLFVCTRKLIEDLGQLFISRVQLLSDGTEGRSNNVQGLVDFSQNTGVLVSHDVSSSQSSDGGSSVGPIVTEPSDTVTGVGACGAGSVSSASPAPSSVAETVPPPDRRTPPKRAFNEMQDCFFRAETRFEALGKILKSDREVQEVLIAKVEDALLDLRIAAGLLPRAVKLS
jgi:hypothetical protein